MRLRLLLHPLLKLMAALQQSFNQIQVFSEVTFLPQYSNTSDCFTKEAEALSRELCRQSSAKIQIQPNFEVINKSPRAC